jgi:hypothetical protein
VLSFQLFVRDDSFGALNIYSGKAEAAGLLDVSERQEGVRDDRRLPGHAVAGERDTPPVRSK